MARENDKERNVRCSFCGKTQEQVEKLIAGPGVYICDECIELCMGIIGENAEKRRLKNGTGNATFRTDLIDAVFNMNSEELSGGIRDEIYERRN